MKGGHYSPKIGIPASALSSTSRKEKEEEKNVFEERIIEILGSKGCAPAARAREKEVKAMVNTWTGTPGAVSCL